MILSAFPPSFPSDSPFANPFTSAFNGGFTPWDCTELMSVLSKPSTNPPVITSSSGSDGSSETNQEGHVKIQSDSNQTNRTVGTMDDRKRRRMISNRESAKRSRMRKQKHLDNLRNQVTRFRMQNRDLSNRLRFFQYHGHRVRMENDQLRSELTMLRQTLSDLSQILVFQQLQPFSAGWPCNTTISPQ